MNPSNPTTNFPYYMLCIWAVIHVGRPQDIFTFLIPLHIGDITAALTVISYFLTGQSGGSPVRSYPEARLFFIFVVFAALCVPLGYYPGKGVTFLFDFGFKIGLFLWLVARILTTEERIHGMVKAIMFSGFIMAVSAILQSAMAGRIGGGATYDPNDLALVLVTTLPIAIVQGLTSNSKNWKIICFGGGALNLIGIIATRSRGGFLGLIAVAGLMFFVKLPGISKKRMILLLSIFGIVFGTYVGTEYKARIRTIFEESATELTAGSGRIAVWRRAFVLAKDHPILGVGPKAFETAMGSYIDTGKFKGELSREEIGGRWHTAHNSFILVLVEMGIPGLIIFLSIIMRTFRNLTNVKKLGFKSDPPNPLASQATGLQMALVGFLTCGFFLSQSYYIFIYLFCFLSGAMFRISEAVGDLSSS